VNTAKLSTVLIAMVGGGMNPVSLLLKNVVFTTLLVIMLYKVRQPGTLSLFVIVSALVNFLLLGGNVTLIPPMLVAALVSEAVMKFVKSLGWKGAVFWGVGCFDFLSKGLSLAVSYLMMRESPALMAVVLPIVLIGYAGSLIGLYTGYRSMKNKTNNHSGWKINNERELELLKTVQNVLQSACKSHRQNCVHHCQGSQERNAQRTEFQAFAHGRNEERQHRGKSDGQGHHIRNCSGA